MTQRVRTRIAPSPTGAPHVGTAYVALFNYALAERAGGEFILRIEDTDQERSHAASEQMIFAALSWLGLHWDEGPDIGGPHGPYRQSERTEIYREHAEMLIGTGAAYPCFCTRERLDELRAEQRALKQNPGYDGRCRLLDSGDAKARRENGEAHVVRLAMPLGGESSVQDLLRGEIRIPWSQLDDQVLLKSDGFPTYHLANVVDDHLMGISHVVRAEEWLSSLPKHFHLYDSFGWDKPVFCHLPLLRNADKSKISKRKNPVSLNYYRRAGFFPEALINFLALMGWAMPDEREEFSLDEFVQAFTAERISLGGPIFDLDKLRWLNGRYLREMSPQELLARLRAEMLSDEHIARVLPLARERIDTLADFVGYAGFFFAAEVEYDDAALEALTPQKRTPGEAAKALRGVLEDALDPLLEWTAANVETAVRRYGEQLDWAPKELFMALRVAVTGRAATPPLFDTMEVLGKELCQSRLRQAREALKTQKN
jgi:glutamyl-tRNA synthetase